MILFDIETGPLPRSVLQEIEPVFKAPKNLKDPDKIKIAMKKKRTDWYSKAALSPITGEILAVGMYDSVDEKTTIITGEEDDILRDFWDKVTVGPNIRSELVGWNSNAFDIPFLIKRSWLHGIKVPSMLMQSKKLPRECIDLLEMWTINGGERISLDRCCKFLGIPGKNGDGALFYIMLDEDPEQAINYLKNDIKITTEVAKRFGVLN